MVSYDLSHTVSLFDHHKPADVHQLHPSDCPPVRPSSEQNLPGLSKRELCDHCRLSLRISYGRQNFRRPDTYKTDFTAGRSVSALLLHNTSPVFIFNFVVWKTLGKSELMIPSILILTAAPILVSFFTRRTYLKGKQAFQAPDSDWQKNTFWSFDILDHCIMDSFEAITKVGGYMILFSVLIALSENLASCFPAVQILLPVLEITNGIQLIGMSAVSFPVKYILALSLTAFGGICAAAQTQCMIQKAGFSIFPYITQKLATALVTSLLGILYLLCFA